MPGAEDAASTEGKTESKAVSEAIRGQRGWGRARAQGEPLAVQVVGCSCPSTGAGWDFYPDRPRGEQSLH